ncbi:MAG: hypothetical protein QXY62_04760 [Candidatus Altiarchaeota archaeon]
MKTIKNKVRILTAILAICILLGGILLKEKANIVFAQPTPPGPGPGPSPSEYKFNLKKGWNMIGWPGARSRHPSIISPSIGLIDNCKIKQVFWWPDKQEYWYIDVNNPSNNPSTDLRWIVPLQGYWALVEEDCNGTVLVTNRKVNQTWNECLKDGSIGPTDTCEYRALQIPIVNKEVGRPSKWFMISSYKSWNDLVENGYMYGRRCTKAGYFLKKCIAMSPIWWWDPKQKKYIEIPKDQPLDPTKGYWVLVNIDSNDPLSTMQYCLLSENPVSGDSRCGK